ncbi:hypothetical protein Y032_1375g3854 [Ancylostoma ceylanicum]|uniref:Uncharacterized protein n=1 Tax=Ancylostoma ceylanicum TaxID=53326 RepID=A0A016W4Q1_9BILA|nr:hypothetical protein Y032_1375g3854 [Ancylostoma ceylanicum]
MCFNIYDQIDDTNKLTIVRDIRSNRLRMSSIYLKPPQVINSNSVDTSKWIVDKETPVLNSYSTTMIGLFQ